MSKPILGCTTVTFGGPLADKLVAMSHAGFTATELWPRDLYENAEGPEFAVRALAENNLTVSVYQALRDYEGMGAKVRAEKLNIAGQLMDQMDLIGTDILVLCANCDAQSSGDEPQIIDDLTALSELAAARGKKIAYEVLAWGHHIKDYRVGAEIIRKVDHEAFGMMLDSFHYFATGVPLQYLNDIDISKVFSVEIADLPKCRLPIIDVSRNYRLFPGEGAFPVEDFTQAILDRGYDGVTTVEIFNAAYRAQNPIAVAERAMTSMLKGFESKN